jgi:hypothetical protein
MSTKMIEEKDSTLFFRAELLTRDDSLTNRLPISYIFVNQKINIIENKEENRRKDHMVIE